MARNLHETVGAKTVVRERESEKEREIHPHFCLKPQQSGMMYQALAHSGGHSPPNLTPSSLTHRNVCVRERECVCVCAMKS